MFNLGLFELTLFGIIALIVLGPDKLPQAARTLGKWYAFAMHTKNRFTNDVMAELNLLETQRQIQEELANLRRAESEMQARMDKLQGAIRQNRQELLSLQDNQPNNHTNPAQHTNTTNQPDPDNQEKDAWSMIGAFADYFEPKPMTGHFFVLGDYDKKRRLPKAPFLPNYQADSLLYTQQT